MALELPGTNVKDQRDAYRIVVFDQTGSAVLVHCQGSEYHLPVIEIPKFTRRAKQITGFLRDCRQTSSVLLFSGPLEEDHSANYFAVLQTQGTVSPVQEGIDWFPVHYALEGLLTGKERGVLHSSYVKAHRNVDESLSEPFSRLDWIRDLQDWVWMIIAPLGLELRGFEQINGSETFCLIRFDTTLRSVWFKAVGEPNLHEFPITMALTRLFPEYLPTILASQPGCHGWLMDDASGKTLDETERLDFYEYAADALGSLQIQSISKVSDLLQAGCKDLRSEVLINLVDPFLNVMQELMQQQTKAPPPVLSWDELSDLGSTLKDALRFLDSLCVPDTVGHGDFNPGNILVSEDRCVFVDWAEAHVGHPFLTFEYLLSHLRKDCPELAPFEHFIRTGYSRRWRYVLPAQTISAALVFSPLIAVYAYAISGNIWHNPERLKEPRTKGFLRSLARQMKLEADRIKRRESNV
jgi:phosphotransferase family enzyme